MNGELPVPGGGFSPGKHRSKIHPVLEDTQTTESHSYHDSIKQEGEIFFMDQQKRQYVRVSDSIEADSLVEYVREKWNLQAPSLIISVTGGAADFAMTRKDRDRLRAALRRILCSTKDCWIITGGSNVGVMKIVGEAVRDSILRSETSAEQNKTVAIGIATWGAIGTKQFEGKGFPDNLIFAPSLDANHTHFIFCDDKTKGKFGREQKLRGEFEKSIRANTISGKEKDEIPIICLMVDGGPGTIDTVRNALCNGTPSLIVDGSGRAADVMAWAAERSKSGLTTKADLKSMLTSKVKIPEDKLDLISDWLLECLTHVHKMRVFKLDEDFGHGELDKAILQTLLDVGGLDIKKQIELSVILNQSEITEKILQSYQKSDFIDNLNTTIETLAEESLVKNKPQFIKLFLEYVDLTRFLTKETLERVYNKSLENHSEYFLLRGSLKGKKSKERNQGEVTLEQIENALEQEIDIKYKVIYARRYSKTTVPRRKQFMPEDNDSFQCPQRELFVYSLLFVRPEAVDLFWNDLPSKTAAALFAVQLCRAVIRAPATRLYTNVLSKAKTMQQSYREKADEIINQCYQGDYQKTKCILEAEHKAWGKTSCLDMALMSDSKNFFALDGVQRLITEEWNGEIDDSTSFLSIFACVLFPPLLFIIPRFSFLGFVWIRFRDDLAEEQKRMEEDETVLTNQRLTPRHAEDESENTNNICSQKILKEIPKAVIKRVRKLYMQPVATFSLNVIAHLIFITMFIIVNIKGLQSDMNEPWTGKISNSWPVLVEYIIIFWIFTHSTEELRQFFTIKEHRIIQRIKRYFLPHTGYWNIIDASAIVLFVLGVVFRIIHSVWKCGWAHEVSMYLYVLTLILHCIRLTSYLSVSEQVGPKIVMIGKMIKDLCYFMCIFMVFVLAYGIAVQSLIYPDVTDPPFSIFWGIFVRPFYETFGEPSMDEIGATDKCTNGTDAEWPYEHCPDHGKTLFALILKCLYMVFTNVLLLNLLIAMFNYRYNQVNEASDVHWKFQMYSVVQEYKDRPKLPPPLIIFSYAWMLLTWSRSQCKRNVQEDEQDNANVQEKSCQTDTKFRILEEWEDISVKELIIREERRRIANTRSSFPKSDSYSLNGMDFDEIFERMDSMLEKRLKDHFTTANTSN